MHAARGLGNFDLLPARTGLVVVVVHVHAEVFQTLQDHLADIAVVFRNACGHDDRVHAAEGCRIRADKLAHFIAEHLAGKRCALVALLGCGGEIAEIAAYAGDAEHALVKAINEYKDQTGVIASIDKDNKLVLTAVDGRNIHVQSTAAGNKFIKLEADFGPGKGIAQDSVFMGSIRLVSDTLFKADGAGSSAAARELSLMKMGLAGGGNKTEATSDLKGDGTFIAGINYDTAIANADVTTQEGAEMVIRSADYAITRLDSIRSGLGSVQNQLTSTVANLAVTKINVQSTESTIRDVDFAQESSVFSKMQVLMQAGTYVQSQANASAQNVMKLLQ